MIILKGSRRYIQSLGNDFWLVWKGFISHVNEFTKKNNNASELLRDIDILIGTILEKEAFVSGEPKQALVGLSIILHDIRAQVTTIDAEFNTLNKPKFLIQKKKLEKLVVQSRGNLMLAARDLKNVDFSRREFLGSAGKRALALVVASSFGLSSALLEKIALALEKDNDEEVRKLFKSVSVPFTGQIKPTVIIQIPRDYENSFQEAKKDKVLCEELRQTFVESIRTIRQGETFSSKERKNSLTYIHHQKYSGQTGMMVQKETQDSVGTSLFTEENVKDTIKNKNRSIVGLLLSVYHGFRESLPHQIYFQEKELLAPSLRIIAYCKEYDLALYLFTLFFKEVQEKAGVRFTTSLKEGEEVYLFRDQDHPNYKKYGSTAKGKILISSYFHPNMQTVELVISSLETNAGDSGSPIFNKNGDVVGVLHGSLEYRIPRKQGSISVFIRSKYVLSFLTNIEQYFAEKLK